MFGGKEKSRTFASAIEKQTSNSKCPDGGIGRRAGLKHQWIHFHPGSTPGLGTESRSYQILRVIELDAQMAESVDALVSNTSGFTSIPVRPRVWVQIKRLSD